jgi:hypothetical protein
MSANTGCQVAKQSGCKRKSVDTNDEYIDLSQHAAEERFPKDDLVVLQPKNSLVLPLLQNRRFPVSNQDVKYFCAIVELAYTKGTQKYVFRRGISVYFCFLFGLIFCLFFDIPSLFLFSQEVLCDVF